MKNMDNLLEIIKRGKLMESEEHNTLKTILKLVGIGLAVIAVLAGSLYFVYKYFTPKYVDEFEDEFDDKFFEDEVIFKDDVTFKQDADVNVDAFFEEEAKTE